MRAFVYTGSARIFLMVLCVGVLVHRDPAHEAAACVFF